MLGFSLLVKVCLILCLWCIISEGYVSPCASGFVPYPSIDGQYNCVPSTVAFEETMNYLNVNLNSFDRTNQASLGISDSGNFSDANDGVANVGVSMALQVKSMYSWASEVPRDMFLEYVAPFGNVNEARVNWRPLLLTAVQTILTSTGANIDDFTTADVVYAVNSELWYGVMGKNITFKSSQTPLIYDPMSTLAFGYASCTGVSIFLIDALRSIGIPSRIAGTPAWNRVPENGNHNWLEVWSPGGAGWQFLEAAPAGAGETLDNPCDKWFCTPSSFANGTQVFAARFAQHDDDAAADTRYPMAWDPSNTQIPGEDRTLAYQKMCQAC
jgi:hypothetical protein